MEKDITNLKISMKGIKTNLDWILKSQKEMGEKLDNFIESSPKKFASKLTERIMYGMVGIILTVVLTALLYLIILK